jgi:phenylacetic acid degradation operon negative regulatory protein
MARSGKAKAAENTITDELLARRVADTNISCTSMIVNIFGDVISQHGGWIWLGSLISALEPLGYNERLVRTAVYRLIKQDWLQVKKIGRRSYYSFTETANRHYEKAARRIYSSGHFDWDGYWTLVVPSSVPDDTKEEFRRSLLWQGFSPLATGMYAHPSAERVSLDETLYDLGLIGEVVVFKAATEDAHSQSVLRELVQEKWNLSELQQMYSEFLAFYSPLIPGALKQLSTRTSFLLRAVLTHDYRRILLRDPNLPEAMLPQLWPGFKAYELFRHVYNLVAGSSIRYVRGSLENAGGLLPGPDARFYERFGGIASNT